LKQLHHDNSVIEFECQEERTQFKNKKKIKKEYIQLQKKALEEDKERISTQVPEHEKEKRLDKKKKH